MDGQHTYIDNNKICQFFCFTCSNHWKASHTLIISEEICNEEPKCDKTKKGPNDIQCMQVQYYACTAFQPCLHTFLPLLPIIVVMKTE